MRSSGPASSAAPVSQRRPIQRAPRERRVEPAPIEHSFFVEDSAPAIALEIEEESGVIPARLTEDQVKRRLWFRRMVLRLMAALTALAVVAVVMRIVQSG